MATAHRAAELRTMMRGRVLVDEPLKPLTTIQIGGPAELLVMPETEADFLAAWRWAREKELPSHILGAGSNMLVPDAGLPGLVLRTKPALDHLRFEGTKVYAGSGVSVSRLLGQAARRGLQGAECLAGVPGTVGGALVMNAGTRSGSIGGQVAWVRALDEAGRIRQLLPAELAFGYRSSVFQQQPWIVLEACLQLKEAEPGLIREHIDAALQYRNRTQPLQLPNAGSTFKNPPGDAAGRLIDAAGCKGWRRGDAQISTLHANWVVNLGQARASDVVDLMLAVRQAVWEQFGVALQPELHLMGECLTRWLEGVAGSTSSGMLPV